MSRTVSVVVPCFNESEVISSTYGELARCLGASQNFDFEFVFVDDGSSDGTAAILRDIRKRDPRVKLIRFSRNFGHQAAVSAGIDHAFGDAVAIMDADLQDPPEVLLAMLEKWREGFEVVYGVRRKRKESIFKRFCYRAFYRIWQWMADIHVPLDSGDFCVMDRQVAEVLSLIRHLRDQGIAVVLISHRMPDVFAVADRIVVLRRGRKVADKPIAKSSPEEVTGLITGAIESV